MKGLFDEIYSVMPTLQGWCTIEKAECLASTIIAIRPRIVLEIGVFGGASFIPMALACKRLNCGTCYGIDPWQKAASIEDMDGANRDWWNQCDHESVYTRFLSRLEQLKLNEQIRLFRQRSDSVDFSATIDILHIDGNHGDTASCYDVRRFCPMVRSGGFLYMDDIGWASNAVMMVPNLGFEELYRIGTGAMFQKVR